MTNVKKGTTVTKETKLDPANGVQAAANSFAPNIVNDGGENGTREVSPAATPEPSMSPDPEPETDEQREARETKERNREFTTYVNGELSDIAEQLGYERITLKPKFTGKSNGPVMLYHRKTEEGKVFPSRAAAGDDYISGDELNARRSAAKTG